MSRSFQLFSDEINVNETQSQFIDYLASLQHYYKNKRAYPNTHKMVKTSCLEHQRLADTLFQQVKCIVVVRIGNKLLTNGAQLPSDDWRVNNLAECMERHRIRKIRFWRGYSSVELSNLCDLLATRSSKVLEEGGMRFLLSQRQIKNIEVIIASTQNSPGADLLWNEQFSADNLLKQQWMRGLNKAGIDRAGFLDYFNFNASENKLMQRELQLAAQAIFTTPHAIAELILFMSADPDKDDQIEPRRMFIALQRIENVMLMHSAYENHRILSMLRSTTERFPTQLRLLLLQEALHHYRDGHRLYPSFRLFDFALPELFEAIMDEFAESGEIPDLDLLLLDRRRAGQLLAFCRRTLVAENEIPADLMQDFLSCLGNALKLHLRPILHQDLPPNPLDQPTTEQRLKELQPDLELGYLNVLTAMLRHCEPGTPREIDICERLGSLMDLYFARLDEPTLFPILQELSNFPEERQALLERRILNGRLPQLGALMQQAAHHRPRQVAKLMFRLQPFLPISFINNFTITALSNHNREVQAAAYELCLLRREYLQEIFGLLRRDPQPAAHLLGFNLLSGLGEPQAELLILHHLAETNKNWQLGLLLMLGHFTGKKSREFLMQQAANRSYFQRDFRRAAIYLLGLRREEAAVPLLHNLIKRRNFCRLRNRWQLRCSAAYALELIGTEESRQLLNDSLDHFRRTWVRCQFDRVSDWILCRYRRLMRLIHLVAGAIQHLLSRWFRLAVVFLRRRQRDLYRLIVFIVRGVRTGCRRFGQFSSKWLVRFWKSTRYYTTRSIYFASSTACRISNRPEWRRFVPHLPSAKCFSANRKGKS